MTLLSHYELLKLIDEKVIQNIGIDQVNGTSIDVTLGNKIMFEHSGAAGRVSLKNRGKLVMGTRLLDKHPFYLRPNHFILAQTREVFNLPNNISAEYKMKSSMARAGLNHATAGWCDAGWHNSVLTLELQNVTRSHIIELHEGDPIGQMVFFKHEPVPDHMSYKVQGRYNNDLQTQGVKK